jgi:hypothetical protein
MASFAKIPTVVLHIILQYVNDLRDVARLIIAAANHPELQPFLLHALRAESGLVFEGTGFKPSSASCCSWASRFGIGIRRLELLDEDVIDPSKKPGDTNADRTKRLFERLRSIIGLQEHLKHLSFPAFSSYRLVDFACACLQLESLEVTRLLRGHKFPKLEEASLCAIIEKLAGRQLKSFKVDEYSMFISNALFEALDTSCPTLSSLEIVGESLFMITDVELSLVNTRHNLRKLMFSGELMFSLCTQAGIQSLMSRGSLLEECNIDSFAITSDEVLAAIGGSCPRLRKLRVKLAAGTTGAGLQAVAAGLPLLESLAIDVEEGGLIDSGLGRIAAGAFAAVKEVDLLFHNPLFSQDGMDHLMRGWPDVEMMKMDLCVDSNRFDVARSINFCSKLQMLDYRNWYMTSEELSSISLPLMHTLLLDASSDDGPDLDLDLRVGVLALVDAHRETLTTLGLSHIACLDDDFLQALLQESGSILSTLRSIILHRKSQTLACITWARIAQRWRLSSTCSMKTLKRTPSVLPESVRWLISRTTTS